MTKMSSSGSGYPLLLSGKYIVSGRHHASYRFSASGRKGRLEAVTGFGMDSGKCYYKVWSVVKGKKTKIRTKKITAKKAEKLDYYYDMTTDKARGEEIIFHAYSGAGVS